MSKENKGHQNNEDQTENVDQFDLENSDELMNLATNPRALTDDDFAESKVELRGQYDSFDTTNKARYTEQDIQVLEGLEAVRKRPGMYIGDTSTRGLHHLIYEIVANSVDEALAGRCDQIEVRLNPDHSVTVIDNGSGIPVGIHPKMGIPTVEVVHTILHAGGKFGGGAYSVSGGLHGVGASVVNALAEWMKVSVMRDGKIYEIEFAKGVTTQPLHVTGTSEKTGTITTFKPDSEIFKEYEYDYSMMLTRYRE
ncbi:MAG: ATP-binding protein, partial [Eubacteriales bacterium]|nr:ATP-binding protein [Eubacteriales bacterium]